VESIWPEAWVDVLQYEVVREEDANVPNVRARLGGCYVPSEEQVAGLREVSEGAVANVATVGSCGWGDDAVPGFTQAAFEVACPWVSIVTRSAFHAMREVRGVEVDAEGVFNDDADEPQAVAGCDGELQFASECFGGGSDDAFVASHGSASCW
jgi:hypothetical protein